MKYGETLRQRSIPAWSHYNIDYDDIKHYIKEQTTPGKGKTVAVPGRVDEKLQQFEDTLFQILKDQHHRIDLFVRSKAGEIQRRLDHSKRQLKSLAAPATPVADRRIPVGRLERYGKLENDVLKAGDEIRSLARFTSTQRTALRKLLKKYKKWTGSGQLEERFRSDVLDDPKSFVKLDLGPLLDDYSTTLQEIRSLYDTRLRQRSGENDGAELKASSASSIITNLQAALDSGTKVAFDDAIATVPLGDCGTFASYFVHLENIVELQVLLLQYSRFMTPRSRANSHASPVSSTPQSETFARTSSDTADYYALEADDAERFAQEQNALTIIEREHQTGSTPQKAKMCVRWNNTEEARVAFQTRSNVYRNATMKKKFVSALLTRDATFSAKKAAVSAEHEAGVIAAKQALDKDSSIKSLYLYSACRSRFVGINNSSQRLTMATLDTHTSIQKADGAGGDGDKIAFPFAVLLVRQDGAVSGGMLAALDQSHLVERVRGFSMEYHAIWQTSNSPNIPPPFWLPVLDRDIRKLPPPAMKRTPSSANRTPTSNGSNHGATDSTTAVETTRSNSTVPELDTPTLRSFRKKRRRNHPHGAAQPPQQKYWSEYDHPEDGEASEAYVIYMDPNQKSAFETVFDKLGGLFSRPQKIDEEEALLNGDATPKDSETSDDEDETNTVKPRVRSYGTIRQSSRATSSNQRIADLETQAHSHSPKASMPHFTAISYVASLVVLFVAYILAATGRHKLRYQVDFGVIFAICSSLIFAIAGFASLLRQQDVSYLAWTVGIIVLVVDAIGSGGLLAWMLG
ncbi:hypothetical protein LTR15_004377 [Elasticomyces elasticus]|nr:hypothetical protein LTR15_004377 [Elasticomyces elasticus]